MAQRELQKQDKEYNAVPLVLSFTAVYLLVVQFASFGAFKKVA